MARFEGVGLSCGCFPSRDIGEKIFGGENTLYTMMRVEAALAKAQAELDIIPKEAAEEIEKKCDINLLPEEFYFEQYRITGHYIVALIRSYSSICENGWGQYVHYGTTSQDIMDTATMLQLKDAYNVVKHKTEVLRNTLAELAVKHRSTVVMGRTNDQQALPITLGFRIASWGDELDRSIERMQECENRIFVGQFGGAVGTFASLEEKGIAVRDSLMKKLGLGIPKIAWYVSRDRLAELCSILSILTATLGRIGNEVYNAQKSEVNELAEGFQMGNVGSSTMPHKRNPFVSGRIVTNSRLSRGVVADALASMEGTNERDVRTLWMETEYLTKSFLLVDSTLDGTQNLIENLEIHPVGIERNLNILNGLVFAEAIMMELADTFGRLEAHEMVYQLAQKAISENKSFKEMLLEDSEINKHMSAEKLDEIMIPSRYIGLSEYFTDVVCRGNQDEL